MIEFKHVAKTFPDTDTEVFRDLNFQVKDGEFVVLTGESGIGKSTVLRMIIKEIEPDRGQIWIGERDISQVKQAQVPFYRRNIGTMFQDHRLLMDRTVYQNVELARIAVGGKKKDSPAKIGRILKLLGIDRYHKRLPGEISGGEQAKVCLARALVNNPTLLLADEPTANIDPQGAEELMKLFLLLHSGASLSRGQGTTLLVASHDPLFTQSEKVREIRLSKDLP